MNTATLLVCILAAHSTVASLHAQESPWTGFDTTSYRLMREDGSYLLARPDGNPIVVPTEWLEPLGSREHDGQTPVSSLEYVPEVTAFNIGAGRQGLHLASYDIQEQGSLQAAVGRDVLLILDLATGALTAGGPELGISRFRGRFAGCFGALFHHLSVGDVDCDRHLDLAIVREEISCVFGEDAVTLERSYLIGPMRWYLQRAGGWVEDPDLEGRLPCAGLTAMPLLGLAKTPVDFVLELRRDADPLLSGEPRPFDE